MAAKKYRIQTVQQRKPLNGKSEKTTGDAWRDSIMMELAAIREDLNARPQTVYNSEPQAVHVDNVYQMNSEPQQAPPSGINPAFGKEIQEALKLKRELDLIYEAITETKKEIASISTVGFDDGARPVDELDAVVQGTESATNQILEAIEKVEEGANQLAETLTGDAGVVANGLQDEILRVYEACNFQDITGQRITKVVSVLRFIAARTEAMIDIWGGVDSFEGVPTEDHKDRTGDKALLNGPSLDTEDASSQDDIDALFA